MSKKLEKKSERGRTGTNKIRKRSARKIIVQKKKKESLEGKEETRKPEGHLLSSVAGKRQ